MVDLQKLVEDELSQEPTPDNLINLWKNIFKLHEDGGPENVEDSLLKQIKDIGSAALQNIKEINAISPKSHKKVKKKVTTRRKKK